VGRCACPPKVRTATVLLKTRRDLRPEAGPASTCRPGTSCGTLQTRLLGPDPGPGQPGEAHQDDDCEKLHTVIFFRSWFCISLLRCSARRQFLPAVRAQQVREFPGHPLLRTRTDRQGPNAPNCHLPLIPPPMWSADLRGPIHLAVCAPPSRPIKLCSLP
jgi:hypothetical protein